MAIDVKYVNNNEPIINNGMINERNITANTTNKLINMIMTVFEKSLDEMSAKSLFTLEIPPNAISVSSNGVPFTSDETASFNRCTVSIASGEYGSLERTTSILMPLPSANV